MGGYVGAWGMQLSSQLDRRQTEVARKAEVISNLIVSVIVLQWSR